MTSQPEELLENNLIDQLEKLGYQRAVITNERDLVSNLKRQLEIHNKVGLSDQDFTQILNFINKGNIYERAKILRDRVPYINDKGENKTIELINQIHWCKNEFQVTQQVSIEGRYKNRYDVTLLINGLPLVQIELKRRGLELKEAFNQTNRYERHSYGAGHGLFQFIQVFVISNGVNTKYYANSPIKARSFKQTFYWSDINNRLVTQLADFTDSFLEPCHISKIAIYILSGILLLMFILLYNKSQRITTIEDGYYMYHLLKMTEIEESDIDTYYESNRDFVQHKVDSVLNSRTELDRIRERLEELNEERDELESKL